MKTIRENDVTPQINDHVALKVFFQKQMEMKGTFSFGTVTIPPKKRVPSEGPGIHSGDEYSLILKGTIHTMSGGKEFTLSAGDAAFIPAGEAHWALNEADIDCEIAWVLIEPE